LAISLLYLSKKGPISYDEIFEQSRRLLKLLKMEYLYPAKYNVDIVKDGVDFFVNFGILQKHDDYKSFSIVDSEEARSMLNFYI